jgi:hypothetical protein
MPCYSLTLTWISRTRLDRRKVAMLVTRLTPSDEQANDTCRTPPPSSPDQEVGYAVHIGRFFFAANGAVPHELVPRPACAAPWAASLRAFLPIPNDHR